nr:PREDICTED: sperm-associated antigen 5 isoform X2 [Latimeria chalumnae]|eukprot:XP_014349836.1 PREDICTED: sperm-associated antigen 5 isoform X2 [Latimeria chalumnae]
MAFFFFFFKVRNSQSLCEDENSTRTQKKRESGASLTLLNKSEDLKGPPENPERIASVSPAAALHVVEEEEEEKADGGTGKRCHRTFENQVADSETVPSEGFSSKPNYTDAITSSLDASLIKEKKLTATSGCVEEEVILCVGQAGLETTVKISGSLTPKEPDFMSELALNESPPSSEAEGSLNKSCTGCKAAPMILLHSLEPQESFTNVEILKSPILGLDMALNYTSGPITKGEEVFEETSSNLPECIETDVLKNLELDLEQDYTCILIDGQERDTSGFSQGCSTSTASRVEDYPLFQSNWEDEVPDIGVLESLEPLSKTKRNQSMQLLEAVSSRFKMVATGTDSYLEEQEGERDMFEAYNSENKLLDLETNDLVSQLPYEETDSTALCLSTVLMLENSQCLDYVNQVEEGPSRLWQSNLEDYQTADGENEDLKVEINESRIAKEEETVLQNPLAQSKGYDAGIRAICSKIKPIDPINGSRCVTEGVENSRYLSVADGGAKGKILEVDFLKSPSAAFKTKFVQSPSPANASSLRPLMVPPEEEKYVENETPLVTQISVEILPCGTPKMNCDGDLKEVEDEGCLNLTAAPLNEMCVLHTKILEQHLETQHPNLDSGSSNPPESENTADVLDKQLLCTTDCISNSVTISPDCSLVALLSDSSIKGLEDDLFSPVSRRGFEVSPAENDKLDSPIVLPLQKCTVTIACPEIENVSALTANQLVSNTVTHERPLSSIEERENHSSILPMSAEKGRSNIAVIADGKVCDTPVLKEAFDTSTQQELLMNHLRWAEVETLVTPVFYGASKGTASVLSSSTVIRSTPVSLPETSTAFKNKERTLLPSVASYEAGVDVTPVSSVGTFTWKTPVALLERGMNTSTAFENRGQEKSPRLKDGTAETDSLLWNFSRESLKCASREELEGRLESSLIIIEVLSRQLKKARELCSLTPTLGPSDLRDTFTQTDVTQFSEAEQRYYSLYRRSRDKVQALERHQEKTQQFQESLHQTSAEMKLLRLELACVLTFVDEAYGETQMDRRTMNQQLHQIKALLSQNMEVLKRMREKTRSCLAKCDEMEAQMEAALQAKAVTNQCMDELRSHCAARISSLQLDLSTQRELSAALKEASENQRCLHAEFVESVQCTEELYQQMTEDRARMRLQLRETKVLVNQSHQLVRLMSKKTRVAVVEHGEMQTRMDMTLKEREMMQQDLEQTASELANSVERIEELNVENAQLKGEISRLAEQVSELKLESDRLQESNARYFVELSSNEASLKLLEKNLAEETARLQASRAKAQKVTDALATAVPQLELAHREKEELRSKVLELEKQQGYLKGALKERDEERHQMRELQNQVSALTESMEFIEQESKTYQEQLAETEMQLKNNIFALRERNLKCEELTETITQLREEKDSLQEELDSTKAEARLILLKLGKEMGRSCSEVGQLKEKLQGLTESFRAVLQEAI